MGLTTITVTCLNGYSFQLTLRNTSISNIKKRMYLHFKSVEPPAADEALEHEPTKALIYKQIPYKYRACFQNLLLGTELLKEDADLKHGDTLTLLIETSLYERAALNHTRNAQFMYDLQDIKYRKEVFYKNALDQRIV